MYGIPYECVIYTASEFHKSNKHREIDFSVWKLLWSHAMYLAFRTSLMKDKVI